MAKIIGIHGRAGSGKDTVANYLKAYYTREFRSVAFADPIRAALKAIFGWDDSYFERPLKEQVIEELGKSPRQIMQTLGTEWGRELVHNDLWLIQAGKRIDPLVGAGFNVLVTDVRFENEAQWIRKQGGVVWFLDRDEAGAIAAHKSESGVKFVKGDVRIKNNDTLGALYDRIDVIAQTLLAEDTADA